MKNLKVNHYPLPQIPLSEIPAWLDSLQEPFHDIDTVGKSFAELINDGKAHNGEFIELYPIVKED